MIGKPVKFTAPLDEKIPALESFLSSIGRDALRSASGTYKGDGKASRALSIGFSPKFVIIQRFLDTGRETPTVFSVTGGIQTYRSPEQTITSAGSLTLAHNLVGVTDPVLIQVDVYLICKTEEAGYAVGNSVKVPVFFSVFTTSDIPRGMSLTVDSANLTIRYGNASTVYELVNKTTGAMTNATNANWKAIFVARYLNNQTIPTITDNMLFASYNNPGVSYIPSSGYVTNGVIGFTNTGITLGNNSNVNAETKTYTYFAIG